ncbi:MAG: lysylphosphatidylglycerol synthase transmembrane domain-containing protein [Methanomicrobiales archaeon]|nr:lysylphosphatidylglycerol synthase transmembrane domain-containing protein [Methanomicrobiales archaeon]
MFKKISAIVIPTLIAAGIIIYMLLSVWDELLIALQHVVPLYIVPAVLVCLLAWILRGARYMGILKSLQVKAGMLVSTACIFVSQTANLVIPARLGDLVRIFILKHEYETSVSTGISSLVVERLFDIIMVALLGVLMLPFVLNVPQWFYWVIVAPLIIGAVFMIVLVALGRVKSGNKYIMLILTMLDEVRKASLSIRSLIQFSALSVVIWLLDIGVCIFVVYMFGQSIGLPIVVLAIVIGNLVKAVPLTPGGVGTYELAVALVLQLAGVEPALAFLIAVTDHLIKNLVTLIGGVISIYYLGDWVLSTIKSAFNKELGEGAGGNAGR